MPMPAGGSRSGVHTGTEREHDYKPYRVVRVDTSKPADNNDDEASHQEDASDEELEISPLAKIEVDPLVGGEEDVGKGVARKMTGKTGASVFRGLIVKGCWSVSGRGRYYSPLANVNTIDPGILRGHFINRLSNDEALCLAFATVLIT
jgi:hypothetical protein